MSLKSRSVRPYGGGFGHVSFTGSMDMALWPAHHGRSLLPARTACTADHGTDSRKEWTITGAAGRWRPWSPDSAPESEHEGAPQQSSSLGQGHRPGRAGVPQAGQLLRVHLLTLFTSVVECLAGNSAKEGFVKHNIFWRWKQISTWCMCCMCCHSYYCVPLLVSCGCSCSF